MGGHGHGHGIPPVPDYKTFSKWEDYELPRKYMNGLKKRGLKDPWIRNETWRFMSKENPPHSFKVFLKFCFRGWYIALPALALTIGVEKYLGVDYHGHLPWEEHGHGHH